MAIRFTKIGVANNETTIAQGTLLELIQSTQTPGTKAWADDVPGVALEWKITAAYPTGAWFGDFGTHADQAALSGYVAYMGKVALGISATISGTLTRYGGAGVGWVAQNIALDDGLLVFGDSIVAQNVSYGESPTGDGMYIQNPDAGPEMAMQRLLGAKRFHKIYIHGYAGYSAHNFTAKPGELGYQTNYSAKDIINSCKVSDCLLAFGTNDLGTWTAAETLASVAELIQMVKDSGKTCHVRGVLPRGNGYPGNDAALQKRALAFNRLLRNYCISESVGYIPVAEVLGNYAVSESVWAVPYGAGQVLGDGVHLGSLGADNMAKTEAAYFSARRSAVRNFGAAHNLESYSSDNTCNQLLTNPRFLNGTASWTLPSASGVFSQLTFSTIPSPDGIGNALAIDAIYSGAGTFDFYQLFSAYALAVGDTVASKVLFSVAGLNGSGAAVNFGSARCTLQVGYSGFGGTNFASTHGYGISGSGSPYSIGSSGEFGLFCHEIKLKSATPPDRLQQFSLAFAMSGAGSCRIAVYAPEVLLNVKEYGDSGIPYRP